MALESRRIQKTAAVGAGTQVLQLSDSELPELQKRLTQLEKDWTVLTNNLPSVQHTMQQVGQCCPTLSLFQSFSFYPSSYIACVLIVFCRVFMVGRLIFLCC